MLKKLLKPSNLILIILLGFIIYQKVPLWIQQHQKQGIKFPTKSYSGFTLEKTNYQATFPSPNRNTMAIFWATWCGPCKLEMMRLKKSVLAGKIPKNSIYAINSYESLELQKKHVDEHQYPFIFIQDKDLSQKLEVTVTPTTALFNKNTLQDLSSGISVIGIKQAEDFLKPSLNLNK